MKQVAYHNSTKKTVHIGTKSIRPGETREVDETLIPNFKAEKKAAPDQTTDELLLSVLDKSIPDIVKLFPDMDDKDLNILEEAENNGKTRTGLINAIAEERIERASKSTSALDAADLVMSLSDMEEDELLEQLNVFEGDEGRLALVQDEIDLRAKQNAAGNE